MRNFFLITSALAAFPFLATSNLSAQNPPPYVTTNIVDVKRGDASTTGSLGLLSFRIAQDIVNSSAPDERLGGAVIRRADYPSQFAGSWAQAGYVGGWLGPLMTDLNRYTSPSVTLFENAYFDNELYEDASPTVPGDHLEFGMAVVPFDTPLPWGRERSAATGTLEWETTVTLQPIRSEFSGVVGEMDVIMFRADIIARGGDVDARAVPIQMPPLAITLPGTYASVPSYVGLVGLGRPYLSYITEFTTVPVPTAGQIVINAEISGYIPEAQVYALPNGAVMKEWHLPLTGVLVIDRAGAGLTPVATASLPAGGAAIVFDSEGTRRVEFSPGARLVALPGASQNVSLLSGASSEPSALFSGARANSDAQAERAELIAAATINHDLAQPVALDLASSAFQLTLDPNYRDAQTLTFRDVRDNLTRKSYADAVMLPFVALNGTPVPLEQARLVDLRAFPSSDGGGFTGWLTGAFPEFNQTAAHSSRFFQPGLLVHAVYDLGDGLHAFVEHQLFHGGVPDGGRLNSNVLVKALDPRPIHAYPTQYAELTETGPAFLSSTEFTTEFGPVAPSLFNHLEVGDHRLNTDYRTIDRIYSGNAFGLRSLAPLFGRPPDSALSISGQKVTVITGPPPTIPASTRNLSVFRVGLANGPVRPPAAPPALGQACGSVAVTDIAIPDAPPSADIREAWFEADGANLYVSFRLAEVPTVPVSPLGDRYGVTWRVAHESFAVRATLAPNGTWSFVAGGFTFGSFMSFGAIPGSVLPGPNGVVRMTVPRDAFGYEDGTMLRDTAAYSFVGTTANVIDSAPNTSSAAYGLGNDYIVRGCQGDAVQLLRAASIKTHGTAGAFEIDLPLLSGPGIENRSGGANGEHTIVFTFATPLANVGTASVTSGTGSVSGGAIDSSDPHRYLVNLTNVSNAQLLTLQLSGVTDTGGHVTNEVSLTFGVLLGDTGGNGSVNASDIGQTKANSGQATHAANFRTDINANGVINSSDIGVVKSQSGASLPAVP